MAKKRVPSIGMFDEVWVVTPDAPVNIPGAGAATDHLQAGPMKISKSKFVAGIQCLKRLYWQVHQPELGDEPGEAGKAVIEQGKKVGLVAQQEFPGGVVVEAAHTELGKAIRMTKELTSKSEVPAVFEATFEHGGVLVRTDILSRSGRKAYRLIEVKSSTEVKPHYSYDVAIQRYVLKGAGLEVERAGLMHLNSAYVYDGKAYDVSRLFTVADPQATQRVTQKEVADRLKEQFRVLRRRKPPDIKPGKQCEEPVHCEFYDQCNPELPEDHVSFLPRIKPEKIKELAAAGISSIKKIPADFPLSERQRRAVDCVKGSKPFFSSELATELAALKYPLCYMDFETIFPALPRFAGMGPYDHIPFQWSVHRQEKPGEPLKHFEYLAEDTSDPRRPFLESLLKAVKGAKTIIVYNQTFEYSRLDDLARWLPAYAREIESVKAAMWDLLIVVRQNVYHPAFGGSYSLKDVVPAFVPEMTYETLEIGEGIAAGLAWEKFIAANTASEEKSRLRPALLAYCGQDTLALPKLVEALRQCIAK